MKKIEKKIKDLYRDFFITNDINPKTGEVKEYGFKTWKFASYPFIGSNYGDKGCKKILFVGLDLGKDESRGRILGFKEKREVVESMHNHIKTMNPNMSGTYITSIYFLQNWFFSNRWGLIKKSRSYKEGVRIFNINLLSFIALINLYKFVTKNRKRRSGGENRKHIFGKEKELQLLLDEIEVFNPDILIFQSRDFLNQKYHCFFKELKKAFKDMKLFIAPQPAYHGPRSPLHYFSRLKRK